MTLEKLRQFANNLPADTIVLIDPVRGDMDEIKTLSIKYHTDGRAHLILSNEE